MFDKFRNIRSLRFKNHGFFSNPLSVFGIAVIAISIFISIFGYFIIPDSSPYANNQFLELATRKPGTRVLMIKIRLNQEWKESGFFSRMFYGKLPNYKYIPIDGYAFGNTFITVNEYGGTGDAAFQKSFNLADVVYPLKFNAEIKEKDKFLYFTDVSGKKLKAESESLRNEIVKNQLVSKIFILGTDRFGRDMFSRLVLGTRISLSVGFISIFISLLIGVWIGAIAGYYRGKVDNIILWLINVVWSVPTLLMVIAITLVLGKGFWQVFVAVGLTMWVEVARVVRGQVMGVREKEYIEAARALGFSNSRIIFKHIIPNIINPVIIISAANFASAILIESGLSFLGIGVQPPIPSWGNMIKDHYGYIVVDMAYLAILPGLAIMLMVLAFTLVGNGLRDSLDVRSAR